MSPLLVTLMKIILLILFSAALGGCTTDSFHSKDGDKTTDFSRTKVGLNTQVSAIDADLKTGKIKVGALNEDAAPSVAILAQFFQYLLTHPTTPVTPALPTAILPGLSAEPPAGTTVTTTPATITTTTTVAPTK